MSPLTIGGKLPHEIQPKVIPLPKPDTYINSTWGQVNEDPFPIPRQPTPERVSWLADAGIWAQQFTSECASTARKLHRLKQKLDNPELDASPHRPAALDRMMVMQAELAQLVRDTAWHEAEASRYWKSLEPEERGMVAGHWMTDPEAESLIGQCWYGIGSFETWPVGFRVLRQWFTGWPWGLITDMQEARVFDWNPSPRPPMFLDERNDPHAFHRELQAASRDEQ